MRTWISLALLATVVAALGAWLYLKPAARDSETQTLSALKSADVKRVRVERFNVAQAPSPGSKPQLAVALERHEDNWRITAPFAARADTFQVGRLLMILDARSAVRYPAADLARFALDRPSAKVTLEDQVFAFGAINTTTREQYVLTGDSVYLIPLGPGAALPRDPNALIARELFAPGETPVRLELPEVTAALQDGTWRIEPAQKDASADDRVAWIGMWQHAIALRAARYDGAAPAQTARVTLKQGPPVTMGIAQREPELVLVRTDEGVAYHFAGGIGKRLLSPPGARAAKE